MNKFNSTLILTIVFLCLSTPAAAQTASPSPTPPVDDGNVVKITTNLIQIDAVVTGKDGKTVTDLTAADFEIYENNVKQEITNFSFVSAAREKTETIKKPAKDAPTVAAPPPFPNKLRPEQVRRTIALVVDDLGLSFASIDAVKFSLKKFVDEQIQPGDLVAITRTSAGAGALQQFTSDKRMLYAAIGRIRWFPSGRGEVGAFTPVYANPSPHGKSDSDDMPNVDKKLQELKQETFTIGTLGAVNYVIRGMSQLPGRKALLLFSDGFKLSDTVTYSKGAEANGAMSARIEGVFRRLTDLANRSSVVIYGIDARGVLAPMANADDYARSGDSGKFGMGEGKEAGEIVAERTKFLFDTQQGLKHLSEQTGGFAVTNNNNLVKSIERALDDQKGYYLLGYQPDDESFDPKKSRFNKLTVKLKRNDLNVRYRSGFFGIKDAEATPQPTNPRQQILASLMSPLNSGDIDLRLTSLYANDAQTGDFMRSLLYVNGRDLKFTPDADGWEKATFEVVAMTFGDSGNVVDEVSRMETIKARNETLQEIREKGFVATITVPVKKPGAYQLRVVMRDNSTAHVGSASQFIEVPNLKKDRLSLSGLLLQRVQPRGSATTQKTFQSEEERDLAVRRFRAGTDIRFGFAIYNAKLDKTTNSPNLAMQFKIFRDGKETFASREKSVKISEQTDLQRFVGEGVFALGQAIPPGDYVLQVIVRDLAAKDKNQIAFQWIDFEVN